MQNDERYIYDEVSRIFGQYPEREAEPDFEEDLADLFRKTKYVDLADWFARALTPAEQAEAEIMFNTYEDTSDTGPM